MDCVRAAHEAGADCICLCETNGGMLPFQVEEVVCIVVGEFPGQQFGIHCHNDTGCAVANTLGAVSSGVRQVHGTVNGLGERVGNTDLHTVIADLELKMGSTRWGSTACEALPRCPTTSPRWPASRCPPTTLTSGALRSRTRAACTPAP